MTIYIALLRGINVGGKNIIKMVDLKKTLENMGLSEVKTYIQSGNVLFVSDEEDAVLRKKIEDKIESVFGCSVTVILRTASELEWIVNNCPFSQEEISQAEESSVGESLYVAYLLHAPSQEKIEALKVYKSGSEEYKIIGNHVFLLFRNGIRNSKLANNLHKLNVPATVRNWITTKKLVGLAKDMEKKM